MDLFAGIPVSDFGAALVWYEALLGASPSFFPHDAEAVWEVAEHRYVYIVQKPEHAGHAVLTLFVEDLSARMTDVAERGLEPARQETFGEGVLKTTYVDPDGNEISLGGAPLST